MENLGKINRRDFLKKSSKVLAGVTLSSISYDYVSKFLHSTLSPEKYKDQIELTINKMKEIFPHMNQWIDCEEWASFIKDAFNKNDFELNNYNIDLCLTLLQAESGFRNSPRVLDYILSPNEEIIRRLKITKPQTSGAMEFSVRYLMEEKNLNYKSAIEELNKPEVGIYYGVKHLKQILEIYSSEDNLTNKTKCIFADYNAGLYASRNAAVQKIINQNLQTKLREDGLLFSDTKNKLKELFPEINDEELNHSLELADDNSFTQTKLWKMLEELNNKKLSPIPADRPVLGIYGVLKKILIGYDNSRDFAEERFREYETILKIQTQN